LCPKKEAGCPKIRQQQLKQTLPTRSSQARYGSKVSDSSQHFFPPSKLLVATSRYFSGIFNSGKAADVPPARLCGSESLLVAQDKVEVTIFRRSDHWQPQIVKDFQQTVQFLSLKLALPLRSVYERVRI
jgi:hypothetical protein